MKFDPSRVEHLLKQEKTEDVIEELIALNFGLVQTQLSKFYLLNDPEALSLSYEALYNAILTYKHKNKFSTYATVCIYNSLGSYVRKLNNQINSNTEVTEDEELHMLSCADPADKQLLVNEGIKYINKSVNETIADIKNESHAIIVETWVDSNYTKSHTEIAKELGCSQSNVSSVIRRFKVLLKQKLEEMEYA